MPYQPILAVSNNIDLARSFNILLGTTGIYVNTAILYISLEHIPKCLNHLWKKYITKEDMVLVVALGYPGSAGE